MILLVGGGTGTGKSTVATEVAYRLGITRVTSTDFVRQTMRAFFAREFMPSIHYSSFEAGARALTKAEEEESGDAALLGFLDQTRNVLVGVEAALAARPRRGLVDGARGRASRAGDALDRARGRARRPVRARDPRRGDPPHPLLAPRRQPRTASVPVDQYIAGLPEIRMIQEYVLERARAERRAGDRERERDQAIGAVLELVLEQAERAARVSTMIEEPAADLPVRALRPSDGVGGARGRALARARRPGRSRGRRGGRDARRPRAAADQRHRS